MSLGNIFVGDDCHTNPRQTLSDFFASARDQAFSDQNFIGSVPSETGTVTLSALKGVFMQIVS